MNRYDCETIRDLLPSYVRGEMLSHEAVRVEQHLADCTDCPAEAGIVRLLQDALAPMPEGLEARVITAVRRRRGARRLAAPLAAAAVFAVAALGGALVFQGSPNGGAQSVDVDAVSWAAAEDPLLHGRSALHELSVDELEFLLEELDP